MAQVEAPQEVVRAAVQNIMEDMQGGQVVTQSTRQKVNRLGQKIMKRVRQKFQDISRKFKIVVKDAKARQEQLNPDVKVDNLGQDETIQDFQKRQKWTQQQKAFNFDGAVLSFLSSVSPEQLAQVAATMETAFKDGTSQGVAAGLAELGQVLQSAVLTEGAVSYMLEKTNKSDKAFKVYMPKATKQARKMLQRFRTGIQTKFYNEYSNSGDPASAEEAALTYILDIDGNGLNQQSLTRQIRDIPDIRAMLVQNGVKARIPVTFTKKTNYLNAFPQWSAGAAKAKQRLALQYEKKVSMLDELSKADSKLFKQIKRANPDTDLQFDGKRWTGGIANQLQRKMNSHADRLEQNTKAANQLLAKTQDNAESEKLAVPLIVQQVVKANDQLSKVGFGPISNSPFQIPLYAGRWVDTATGRVRILPQANSKYLNPASFQQRAAYLEAKIINHWNSLVATTQQRDTLIRLGKDGFQKRLGRSIKSGLDLTNALYAASNQINRTIQAYWLQGAVTDGQLMTPKYRLLYVIGQSGLQKIYKLHPEQIGLSDTKNTVLQATILQKMRQWRESLTAARDKINKEIAVTAKITPMDRAKLTVAINRAFLNLYSYGVSKVRNTLKKIEKIRELPMDATMENLNSITEKFETLKGSLAKVDNFRAQDIYAQAANLKSAGAKLGIGFVDRDQKSRQDGVVDLGKVTKNFVLNRIQFSADRPTNLPVSKLFANVKLKAPQAMATE